MKKIILQALLMFALSAAHAQASKPQKNKVVSETAPPKAATSLIKSTTTKPQPATAPMPQPVAALSPNDSLLITIMKDLLDIIRIQNKLQGGEGKTATTQTAPPKVLGYVKFRHPNNVTIFRPGTTDSCKSQTYNKLFQTNPIQANGLNDEAKYDRIKIDSVLVNIHDGRLLQMVFFIGQDMITCQPDISVYDINASSASAVFFKRDINKNVQVNINDILVYAPAQIGGGAFSPVDIVLSEANSQVNLTSQ